MAAAALAWKRVRFGSWRIAASTRLKRLWNFTVSPRVVCRIAREDEGEEFGELRGLEGLPLPLSVRNRTEAAATECHALPMTHPFNAQRKKNARGTAERGEYLIDGHRVSFLHQADWNCACREFTASGVCRHTREARGMREAQALIRRRTHQQPVRYR